MWTPAFRTYKNVDSPGRLFMHRTDGHGSHMWAVVKNKWLFIVQRGDWFCEGSRYYFC